MNDTSSANTKSGAASTPLFENEYVKELFSILKNNNKDTNGLTALICHVNGLEAFVKQAEGKIADMKTQLDTIKEIQNHPIKTILQNITKSMEALVVKIKNQVADLKTNIIEGCKNAVAAFKNYGVTALDKLASFFNLKSTFQDISKNIDKYIKHDDNAIAMIATFSKEYHLAGRHIQNMGRALTGKKPIDSVKESGLIAKAISAPYKADRSIMLGMKKAVDKLVARIEKNELNATAKREARASSKPSLKEKLNENKEHIRKLEFDKPVPVRAPKVQGLDV